MKKQQIKALKMFIITRLLLQSNYERIKNLTDTLPFVSERIIGYDDERIAPNKKNRISGLNGCSTGNAKVIVSLLHSQNPLGEIGFSRFIKAIEQGYLHPKELAAIYDYTAKRDRRIKAYNYVNTNTYEVPNLMLGYSNNPEKDISIDRVNKDRDSIGLCKFETKERMKVVGRKYKLGLKFGYK